jgi:4-amino-4-deoxy-L-arabinose transferase-like glycosyltransferase
MTPTWDMGNIMPDKFSYYTNHPPLFSYMVALGFKVFGIHEWSARLVSIIFSLGSLILFYLIARLLWGIFIAWLSLFFLGFSPAFLYYGRMVNHEPIFFLFFVFSTIYFYLKFLDERKKIYLLFLSIFSAILYLTAWQAFYLSAILITHYIIFSYNKIKDKRPIIVLSSIPVLFAFFYAAYIYLLKGSLNDNITAMINCFNCNIEHQFTWPNFLLAQFKRIEILFGKTMLFLTVFYAVYLIKNREDLLKETVAFIFLALAVINIIIFRQGAWNHDYQLYYFIPFLSIAAAKGISEVRNIFQNRRIFYSIAAACIVIFLIESCYNFISIHSFKFKINFDITEKINSTVPIKEEIGTNFEMSIPLSWYVDRKYKVIKDIRSFQDAIEREKLSFFILIPKEDMKLLKDYLDRNYPYFIYKDLIFYDLKTNAQ